MLTPIRRGALFEVDTVVADGSTVGEDAGSTIVSGKVLGLAGSPDTDQASYAVTDSGVIDLHSRATLEFAGARVAELLADLQRNALKIHEHGGRADGIVRSMLLHSR